MVDCRKQNYLVYVEGENYTVKKSWTLNKIFFKCSLKALLQFYLFIFIWVAKLQCFSYAQKIRPNKFWSYHLKLANLMLLLETILVSCLTKTYSIIAPDIQK